MSLNVTQLQALLLRCAARLEAAAPELNELDGKLGDGDLGATLQKCAANIRAAMAQPAGTIDGVFKACAMACARASGSSFGTLLGVAFLSAARETAGRAELASNELAPLFKVVLEALMSRGGASLGDKTVLDPIAAVHAALARESDPARYYGAALAAVESTLSEFRDKPNRIGRARMFAERSIGLNDPGMIAFRHMVLASVEQNTDNTHSGGT